MIWLAHTCCAAEKRVRRRAKQLHREQRAQTQAAKSSRGVEQWLDEF